MRRGRGRLFTALLLLPSFAFTSAFFAYPLVVTVRTSLSDASGTGYSLTNYAEILGSAQYWQIIGLTVFLGVTTGAASVAVAIPLALVLRRHPRGHQFVRILVMVPLVVLTLVSGLGLLIVWSDTGWAGKLVEALAGSPLPVDYTVQGLVLFYTWLFAPFTILTTLSAFESINPDIEEAARVCGASPTQVLRRVSIPLSVSGIRAGSILTFLLAFEAIGIPLIAGGNNRPLAVAIYTQAEVFNNFPVGSALAVVIAVAALAVLLGYQGLLHRHSSGR